MLRITSAEVYKNSRILLGDDCHIRYTPVSNYQVILGQNGIGKSTFLSNLLSYPSLGGKAFHKEGFSKVIFETEQGEITTRLGADGKYGFYLGDTNLNEGGTQGIQKELYAEHLGITPSIEAILNPSFDFLAMTAAKRQEFLASLTTGDLSFALTLHKSLEQKARQSDNVIKKLELNLAELQAKIIPDDEYELLKKRLEELNKSIKELYLSIDDTMEPPRYTVEELVARRERFKNVLRSEFKEKHPKAPVPAKDSAHAEEIVRYYVQSIAAMHSEYHSLTEQFESLSEIRQQMNPGNGVGNSPEGIQSELNRIQGILEEKNSEYMLKHLSQSNDPNGVTIRRNSIEEYYNLSDMLLSAAADIEHIYGLFAGTWTKELILYDFNGAKEAIDVTRNKLFRIQSEIQSLEERLEHMHDNDVECPECKTKFTPGARGNETRESIEKKLEYFYTQLGKGKEVFEKQKEKLNQAETIRGEVERAVNLVRNRDMGDVYESVVSRYSLIESPQDFIRELYRIAACLPLIGDIKDLHMQKRELEKQLEYIIKVGSTEMIDKRLEELEGKIYNLGSRIRETEDEQKSFLDKIRQASNYMVWTDTKNKEYMELNNLIERTIKAIYNEANKRIVDKLQISSSELAKTINNHEKDLIRLEQVSEMLEKEKVSYQAAKRSADELSPKSGLIAEQLFGFIEAFFNDVMEILNETWSYDITIYPAKDNSESLSYIFPVEFNNSGIKSEDISKTSEGQYAIINFAIRIVALRYKGYVNGPLFLDEPEKDIHPGHKVKMMNFIRMLVEHGIFSQVFIISHHEAAWGALPYPDIVDFTEENTGDNVNKVVTFK